MFTIDFTKPWLYKDIIYFNQGNLSTNNTLRCKLVTGGSDDFTGGSIACTFTTKDSIEISGFGKLVDAKNGIIDIVFPSNSLVVGTNKLEVLVNRADGGVAQSPPIMYDIWQGLTTGNGVEAETNYPILIELINSTNEASNKANLALNKANSMITDVTDAIDNAYRSANEADIATSNANTKIEEVETAKTEMIKQVGNSIANMKVETNTAIDNMVSKTDEKITDVNRAIAAGTKDLEVKESRKDANGVVHDTLEQRLKSDLIVGDKSLKDFVVDMNGMKETQDLAYETNTGYKVCNDTQVGTIKDLKLYGKSLVNELTYAYKDYQLGSLIDGLNKKVTLNCTNSASHSWFKKDIKNGEVWTVSFDVLENTLDAYFSFAYGDSSTHTPIITVNSLEKGHFEKTFTCSKDSNIFKIGQFNQGKNGEVVIDNICLVRNQVANLNYFEGIASVGNGNEIEVLSRNKNLLNYNDLEVGFIDSSTGLNTVSNDRCRTNDFYIVESKNICISFDDTPPGAYRIYEYDINKKFIKETCSTDISKIINLNASTKYIKFSCVATLDDVKNFKIQIEESNIKTNFINSKRDKKPILFKDTDGAWKPITELRGIDLNRCDTIENGKFKNRIKESVLNGVENYVSDVVANQVKTIAFALSITDRKVDVNRDNIISDKFKTLGINFTRDEEGIFGYGGGSGFVIRINRDRLETQDIQGFKKWLQLNNVTIVYELSQEIVYEVNPLDLQSFENETMIAFGSGAIAPHASWKITSSLPNFVKELSNKIKQLQDQVYKTNVANFAVALNTLDTKLRLDRLEAPQM
ncbi:hypothetical protein D4A35_03190 [Paraclostridium bifermentans]|uniref:Uncharacterized protein n=1 Tax=Paraclostridium bifermentans TaxID=1490 RepID=A0A5P3XAJ9_PARBF|nr:hypothetical protein [Paraclostridium bifermentans]QEZ67987.1 hypothetical protein D4A35_03190 [Paraclostridium bifermentans]